MNKKPRANVQTQNVHFNPFLSCSSPSPFPSFPSSFPLFGSRIYIHIRLDTLAADTISILSLMVWFSVYFQFLSISLFLYLVDLIFFGFSIEFHNFCTLPTQIDNLLLAVLFISVPFLTLSHSLYLFLGPFLSVSFRTFFPFLFFIQFWEYFLQF